MNRAIVAAVIALVGLAELLLVGLALSAAQWHAQETPVALGLFVLPWLVTTLLATRQFSSPSGAASTWTHWPAVAASLAWGVLAAGPVWFAAELGLKWLIGLHGLAALGVAALTVLMKGAGNHVDAVEAQVATSHGAHADLTAAITQTRARVGRAGLESALAQRARIALERAQTVPRMALVGSSGEGLVLAVRELGLALESTGDVGAAVIGVEDAVSIVKGS